MHNYTSEESRTRGDQTHCAPNMDTKWITIFALFFCVSYFDVTRADDEIEDSEILKRSWGKKLSSAGRSLAKLARRGLSSKVGRDMAHIAGSIVLREVMQELNGNSPNRRSYDDQDFTDFGDDLTGEFDADEDMYEHKRASASADCGHRSQLSQSDKQLSLELHNQLRGQEGASDMAKMTYNEDLAARAQQLSDTCVWEHGLLELCGGTSLGQNMYVASAHSGYPDLDVRKAIEGWYNEKDDYNYYSDYCTPGKMCGHYTQLAWAKSSEVGCGFTRCPTVYMQSGNWQNAILYVCDYAPSGNWQGEKPFHQGSACSDCPWTPGYGSRCDNGLCAKCSVGRESGCSCRHSTSCSGNGSFDRNSCSCRCNRGFYGDECENSCACEDQEGFVDACPQWVQHCPDPVYKQFLTERCKATCNFCSAPAGAC